MAKQWNNALFSNLTVFTISTPEATPTAIDFTGHSVGSLDIEVSSNDTIISYELLMNGRVLVSNESANFLHVFIGTTELISIPLGIKGADETKCGWLIKAIISSNGERVTLNIIGTRPDDTPISLSLTLISASSDTLNFKWETDRGGDVDIQNCVLTPLV